MRSKKHAARVLKLVLNRSMYELSDCMYAWSAYTERERKPIEHKRALDAAQNRIETLKQKHQDKVMRHILIRIRNNAACKAMETWKRAVCAQHEQERKKNLVRNILLRLSKRMLSLSLQTWREKVRRAFKLITTCLSCPFASCLKPLSSP